MEVVFVISDLVVGLLNPWKIRTCNGAPPLPLTVHLLHGHVATTICHPQEFGVVGLVAWMVRLSSDDVCRATSRKWPDSSLNALATTPGCNMMGAAPPMVGVVAFKRARQSKADFRGGASRYHYWVILDGLGHAPSTRG